MAKQNRVTPGALRPEDVTRIHELRRSNATTRHGKVVDRRAKTRQASLGRVVRDQLG